VRRFPRLALLTTIAVAVPLMAAPPAAAAEPTLGQAAVGGLHNTYAKTAFTYFVDAVASGTRMVEVDVWTTFSRWYVSHSLPFGNDNNCEPGDRMDLLRRQPRNRDLRSCVDNIKAWHDANPGHEPLLVKVEMKGGFQADQGYGPEQFDAVFAGRLGAALFRPADLLAAGYPTPDAAARANAWPAMSGLRGRVLVVVMRGTAENDSLPTEVEYAGNLSARPATAVAFPVAKRDGATGDPRTRYPADLRPWFVVFDGDAASFAALSPAQRSFYVDNRYLFIATDAHALAPALDRYRPTAQQARERLVRLACLGATVVSSDWYAVPGWHGTAPRGGC
jgi:hypothetical protein